MLYETNPFLPWKSPYDHVQMTKTAEEFMITDVMPKPIKPTFVRILRPTLRVGVVAFIRRTLELEVELRVSN